MSDFFKIELKWFLELKPGDKILMYQPKIKPSNELDLLSNIFENHMIYGAFYSKISVNACGKITDYHLVALEAESNSILDDLLPDLYLNKDSFNNFKFLSLSGHLTLGKEIRGSYLFFERDL